MGLENDLKLIGLEEKEAKVYLSALELGPTNIQNLTEKSNIKRSTVYEMLKSLEEKGLISETSKGKRRLFVAAEPETLKKSIKEKEQLLNQILPELRSITNVGFVKPKITYYEGREGLRKVYMTALEARGKKADWVSPMQSVIDNVGEDWMNEYIETKKRMGYWIRSIHISSRQYPTYKYIDPKTFEETLRKVRFSPQGLDIPSPIGIWDDKVAILSTKKEGYGFIIESKDYVQTMKVFYELLWSASKTWEQMNFEKNNSEEKEDEKEDDYWSTGK